VLFTKANVALVLMPLGLRLETARGDQIGLTCDQARELMTEPINPTFEDVVKHVGYHDHPARHPLPGTPEFRVIELRHAGVPIDDRLEHA
jgi:hypothetical protein